MREFNLLDGWRTMNRLRSEMDRVFGDMYQIAPVPAGWLSRDTFPAFRVCEEGDTFLVEAELPGLKLEDIEIVLTGTELAISGERKVGPAKEEVVHRRERGTGPFRRSVRLPVEIDGNKAVATLHDGVLLLTLPKAESAKARKIEIKLA